MGTEGFNLTASPTSDVRPDRSTLLAFVGVVLFGGLNAIAVKQTVRELDPFWAGAARFVLAGLIMAGIVFLTGRAMPRGRSLLGAAVYGALFAVAFGAAYPALREAPAGTAAVFIAMVPLVTLGLAVAHRLEAFRVQGLLGGLVAVVGVAIVFADQLSADIPIRALLLFSIAVVSIAEMGIVVKLIPRSDPFATNAVAMLTAAALLLGVSTIAGEAWAIPTQTASWVAFVYLVVLGSVALFGLFVYALEHWTASAVSYSDLLLPLVTIGVAAVLTGERVTPSFALGGAVILAGVYIGAFDRTDKPRAAVTSLPECVPAQAEEATLPAGSTPARSS
jgi:drug/metabolite transporter (DMT)-like permease